MTSEALCWAFETPMPDTVTPTAHAVLVALCYSRHHATGQCNPSNKRLAKLTGLSATTVKGAIKILKDANLITLTSGKRLCKTNSYTINYTRVPKKPPRSHTMSADVRAQSADVNLLSAENCSQPAKNSSQPLSQPVDNSSTNTMSVDATSRDITSESRDITSTDMKRQQGLPAAHLGGQSNDFNKVCQPSTESSDNGNLRGIICINTRAFPSSSRTVAGEGRARGDDDDGIESVIPQSVVKDEPPPRADGSFTRYSLEHAPHPPRPKSKPAVQPQPRRRLTYDEAYDFVEQNIEQFLDWGRYRNDFEHQSNVIDTLARAFELYKEVYMSNLKDLVHFYIENEDGLNYIAEETETINEMLECSYKHITNMHHYLMACLKNRLSDD